MPAPSSCFLPGRSAGSTARGLFDADEYARQRAFFTMRDARPLLAFPQLAAALGLGALLVKDETSRAGLPAFKSVGVEFAVDALARRGALAGVATLVCASAGNHGRAVARAARVAGLGATIFLDADVAPARVAAIAGEGAEIVRVAGTYDEAVRAATAHAAATGGLVVSDTSWEGYTAIPRDIMLGYTRIMDEAATAWGTAGPPDLLAVQAGVGGLLAAVASWSAWTYGDTRPRLVAVEPLRAACVQASARAGRPAAVAGPLSTIMAGLRCGEVSPAAFDAACTLVDAYVAVDDDWTREAMRRFARPAADDPSLAVGASGAAGLAALLALRHDPALRDAADALGLDATSRVLVIATEGVTEPELWNEVTAAGGWRLAAGQPDVAPP
ncbi:MAG: diaminopropionate ammonia-lyase [Vicinamibacterales bacterium]